MNVDDAMETAAAYLAAHEQEQEPLFDSEEVAITLAAEVERLRAELASANIRTHFEKQNRIVEVNGAVRLLRAYREEVERLRAELNQYKKSLPVCEKHKPDSGCRSGCMICGLEKQSSALSRIDYACGEPNEMQMSLYGLDYDEERVVEAVQRLKAELAAAKKQFINDCIKHINKVALLNDCEFEGGMIADSVQEYFGDKQCL